MDDEQPGNLLRAHLRGDSSAFCALVRRFEAPLLRYARCLCGGLAEDVVQEAFLRLARNPPRLPARQADSEADHGSAALASWLFLVTRNCAMETLRSDRRRRVRESATASAESTDGELRRIDAVETTSVVERALARLPDDQREVLVLRLLAERSYQEIAEITGKKLGTVSWLIAGGLSALARDLAPSMLAARSGNGGVR